MVVQLKVALDPREYRALAQSALSELRNPMDQAHFILRQELHRLGLLDIPSNNIQSETEEVQDDDAN